MTATIIDFDSAKASPYLLAAINGFLADPPDTDYQRGYLAALLAVYREGLRKGERDARVIAAERLL